jgi:uncharacterized protein YfaP (DUF2135 family)
MILGSLLVAGTMAAQETEKKIQRSDLPAAVQKTADAQSKGAAVKGFSTEVENGQKIYEAAMVVNGHSKDVSMDANGKVLEIEEEVAFDSLTDAVKQGLQAKAGKGKLGKVESLTKNGKLVAYEAKVTTGTKKSEVQVGPDGKPLAHEE